jgi:hypothetical protein
MYDLQQVTRCECRAQRILVAGTRSRAAFGYGVDRMLTSGVLERDKTMQVGMDDEQVDDAGWRYGRRKGRRILSFMLPILSPRRQQEGTMLDGLRRSAFKRRFLSCNMCWSSLGRRNPTNLELYDTVDQVGIILATWVSLSSSCAPEDTNVA